MTDIICTVVNALGALLVAIVGYKITKSRKEEELRKERLKEETLLSLEISEATMDLSFACCNALTGGHNNGNVEEAKEKAIKAKEKYQLFERKVLAEEIV